MTLLAIYFVSKTLKATIYNEEKRLWADALARINGKTK